MAERKKKDAFSLIRGMTYVVWLLLISILSIMAFMTLAHFKCDFGFSVIVFLFYGNSFSLETIMIKPLKCTFFFLIPSLQDMFESIRSLGIMTYVYAPSCMVVNGIQMEVSISVLLTFKFSLTS